MPETNSYQLLLNLLRHTPPGSLATPLPHLDNQQWQKLLEQAQQQGVAALLLKRLKHSQPVPPDQVLTTLQKASYRNAAHNLLLYHQLTSILPKLAEQHIPVIALKGLHLSELVYQDPSLRPMNDMDLLVPIEKLLDSYNLLQSIGYQAPDYINLQKEVHRHHHLPPLTKAGAAIVELHWNLTDPTNQKSVDLPGLWQRAQPATLAGIPTLVLSPEDLLLHLALHFGNHNFRLGLRHLYDLLVSLEHYQEQINWPSLLAHSQAWHADRCLFLTLYLAHDLLNAPLPDGVLEQLQPPSFTPNLAEQARQRLLNPLPANLHPDLIQLWSHQPTTRKLKAAWRALFPPLDYMHTVYQTPTQPLRIYPYYLLRLVHLLRKYNPQFWQLLRRNPQLSAAAQKENSLTDWLSEM